MDAISGSFRVASQAMAAQSVRLRVVSENIANAGVTSSTPGGEPYRRKTVTLETRRDRETSADFVRVGDIGVDLSPVRLEHRPGHPAADASGLVKMPNVDVLIEMADMREANRSFQASVQIYKTARELFEMHIDLLKMS